MNRPTQHIEQIDLADLRAHPRNSNVMREAMLAKLAAHIERTGRYPPLIVRPINQPGDRPTYQVLDGHHRWVALERLGHRQAACMVWPVDDEQALVLLATLNRLAGDDDPHRRAALVRELDEQLADRRGALAKLLPDRPADLKKLRHLADAPPPKPAPPPRTDDMPIAVHFFLRPAQRDRLNAALDALGPNREQALMQMAEAALGRRSVDP